MSATYNRIFGPLKGPPPTGHCEYVRIVHEANLRQINAWVKKQLNKGDK